MKTDRPTVATTLNRRTYSGGSGSVRVAENKFRRIIYAGVFLVCFDRFWNSFILQISRSDISSLKKTGFPQVIQVFTCVGEGGAWKQVVYPQSESQ